MKKSKLLKRYIGSGKRLYYQGKYEKAVKSFEKAINLNPNSAYIYNYCADVYFIIDPSKAIEDYSKAIELKPDLVNAYKSRAILNHCFVDNSQEDAEKDYTMALKYAPNNTELYLYRGYFYSDCEKSDLAINDFSSAINLSPNKYSVYILRGQEYLKQKEYSKAIQDFESAMKSDVLYQKADAYLHLSRTYFLLNDYYKAIQGYTTILKDFKSAIIANEKIAQVYKYRSEAYLKLGDKEKAEQDLKVISEMNLKAENTVICF